MLSKTEKPIYIYTIHYYKPIYTHHLYRAPNNIIILFIYFLLTYIHSHTLSLSLSQLHTHVITCVWRIWKSFLDHTQHRMSRRGAPVRILRLILHKICWIDHFFNFGHVTFVSVVRGDTGEQQYRYSARRSDVTRRRLLVFVFFFTHDVYMSVVILNTHTHTHTYIHTMINNILPPLDKTMLRRNDDHLHTHAYAG